MTKQNAESDPPTDELVSDDYEYDHSVTRPNTTKHWVLYSLDAIESEYEVDDETADNHGENFARHEGTLPSEIYEYAAGDDSIVFRNKREVSSALSEMARMAPFYENENRPVNRRATETTWDGADVRYRYRLTDHGRNVLLNLGVPQKLPNRHEDDYERSLGVLPAHQPGWWRDEYDLFDSEWDVRDNDWYLTNHDRVFFKSSSMNVFSERGYAHIGYKLAEIFDDVLFVLTVGPYRAHDIMYTIRDPWKRVVQIDIYSPMAMHRSNEEIQETFEALCKDLAKGLKSVTENPDEEFKRPQETDDVSP